MEGAWFEVSSSAGVRPGTARTGANSPAHLIGGGGEIGSGGGGEIALTGQEWSERMTAR